ncbi:alpha/beta fold hydrolase [Maricaulis parjimensis]|uniref:alpha/beta fold hydrolase n=1 Tax=Maricaulis parjimensis TaxID=144023 RepID=UPI001939508C|nr:alpha/beta fold hydrolase [Maricaulis parjimensis]
MSRFVWLLAIVLIVAAGAAWLLLGRAGPDAEPVAAIESPYWWDAADQLVDVDGVTARVRIEGPDDAPAIVLVHGFSHSLESWDGWAADLSADYRVIRMDLPGHGLTGPDPQARYSVPQTVDFLAGLMDALEIDQAYLAGNSLGGLVAWRYAVDHADRVQGLVLVSPGGFSINGVTEDPVPVPIGVSFFLTQAPEAMVAAATGALYGDSTRMDPSVPTRVHALMRRDGVGEAMVERLEVFTLPDPEADLARVTAPTLILWGERDAMVPVDHAAQFEAAMPDAQVILYPDLGHVAQEEDPARTLADVRSFLSEN